MTTIALLAVVIVIEAVPVYSYLQAVNLGRPVEVDAVMVGAFGLVALVCALATAIPLRVGLQRMEEFEF